MPKVLLAPCYFILTVGEKSVLHIHFFAQWLRINIFKLPQIFKSFVRPLAKGLKTTVLQQLDLVDIYCMDV